MVKKGLAFATAIFIMLLGFMPLVCAQWGWYGVPSPEHWLDNPWFIFVILFAVFFATIFISLGRVFKGNPAPAAVIAAALSFLISSGVQRDWQFLQQPIMFWALIVVFALAVLTFLRAAALGPLGSTGLVLAILGSWPYIKNSLSSNMVAALPYGLVNFFDSISGFFSVLLVIGIICFIWGFLSALFSGRLFEGAARKY